MSLRAASNQKHATIAELRCEVSQLGLDIDAFEQYGRRHSLCISGINEQYEDTTEGVLAVTNGIMVLDPPLKPEDINISHRLNKPRRARQEESRPVIVRFMTKTTRYRVIADWKKFKKYYEENNIKMYINEDLTTYHAKLFGLVRKLQKNNHFSQCWTYNGYIRVKDREGRIRSVPSFEAITDLVPNVDIENLGWSKQFIRYRDIPHIELNSLSVPFSLFEVWRSIYASAISAIRDPGASLSSVWQQIPSFKSMKVYNQLISNRM